MNIRQAVLGPIGVQSSKHAIDVDIGSLVRRLILFDKTIVKSIRLREVPALVRTFRRAGFTELVSSGLLRFTCDATFLIVDVNRNGVRDLPPNHFSFGTASAKNDESILRSELKGLQGLPGLKDSDRSALEDIILGSLISAPHTYGQDLLNQFDTDVRTNISALKLAVIERLKSEPAISNLAFGDLLVQVEETSHRVFHIKTSLTSHGFTAEKSHALLQSALLAISNLDQRLADMQAYSAITGFLDHEAPLLFGRLSSVIAPLNPNPAEKQFERVIELADVPDFKPGQKVDVERLLMARESTECREFREWLSSSGSMSDEQIEEMVASIRSKIASLAGSTTGKVLRFATTTGVGLIPVVGPIAGAAAGAIDSFLIDRVLPKSGVVAFLSETYPSLFVSP
jgi:hypothetical protein